MVFPIRIPRTIARLSLLPVALLTLATAERQAAAQTAPTLLPYTISLVAGSGTTAIATGATCPSGFKSTDAFGDGCLATEVQLSAPRFVTTDKNGVVFFSDTNNNLVRRIDPSTGIITTVVGGATTNPAAGAACASGSSSTATNSRGDGCLSTQVKLNKPEGLAFSPAGDLYVAENGADDIRKIAATAGVVTTGGTITSVVFNSANTFGYNVNNTSTSGPVIAATNGYLNFPYGIAFDAAGNLYVADEGNQALEVINLGTTAQTVQGVSIPAGSIQKFVGYGNLAAKTARSGDCPDFVSTSSRGGCYFGSWTDGSVANTSNLDGVYDVVVDPAGNVYFANEFNDNIGLVTPANVISNFAGKQGGKGTTLQRGAAGSFSIGSNFNVGRDSSGNIYTSDAINGVVWRVDAGTGEMYVVAGGATSVCANATDTAGDGCPGTQAKLSIGTLNGSGFATAPGVAGVSPSIYSDLYITDATANTVRVASTGAWFGPVGANQPTQQVVIHFAAGDSPAASGAYTLTSGASNFSIGTASCTTNSDNTQDCFLNVTATPPATLGPFNGTLQVKSKSGGTASFLLGGIYVQSPITRVGVTVVTTGTACTGGGAISTATPQTITATVFATTSPSGSAPTGTVTFFANGNQIGTPQAVGANNQAKLTYTFSSPASYTVSATYSGDSYFKPSTGTAATQVVTSNPTFTVASTGYQEPSVVAGGTALYSFALNQSVYTGTITFACQGLPAYASCVFSPPSITATGCSTTNTVAVSIYTQQATSVNPTSLAGRGRWMPVSLLFGIGLSMMLAFRRRRFASRLGGVGLMLAMLLAAMGTSGCGKGTSTLSTPLGTYTITITATGTAGTVATLPVTLKVN